MNKDGVSAKLETNQDDGSLDTGGQPYMIINEFIDINWFGTISIGTRLNTFFHVPLHSLGRQCDNRYANCFFSCSQNFNCINGTWDER